MTAVPPLAQLAAEVVDLALARGMTIAAAESLTAGMVCAELGSIPGASGVLQGGAVSYQNHIKVSLLGVDPVLLAGAGPVDGAVARQMAAGARHVFSADLGVSTTGVAGPEPHGAKPVGTVFVSVISPDGAWVSEHRFDGDRAMVRTLACRAALDALLAALTGPAPGNKS